MIANRPSKPYAARYCAVAKKIYELGGAAEDVAAALGASLIELGNWEHSKKEFAEASQTGRHAANDRVEEALLRLCAGYAIQAEKAWLYKGQVLRQEYRKEFLSDPAACMFWLTHRSPGDWKTPANVPQPIIENPMQGWYSRQQWQTYKPQEECPDWDDDHGLRK